MSYGVKSFTIKKTERIAATEPQMQTGAANNTERSR